MRSALCWIALLVLYSCAGGEDVGIPARVVHDNAGVRIVEHSHLDEPEWRIDTIPTVTIGTLDGRNGQDLGEPFDAIRLANGRIAISDWRPDRLRLYDRNGVFLSDVGRTGRGPGEFVRVGDIFVLRGDTLAVANIGRPEVHFFDADGKFLRTLRLTPVTGRLPFFADILASEIGVYRPVVWQGPAERAGRDTVEIQIRRLDSDSAKTVGRFPGAERSDGGFFRPFYRTFHMAASDSLLWVGVSDRYELQAYDTMGHLRTVIRANLSPRSVTAENRDAWFENELSAVRTEAARADWLRRRGSLDFPQSMPFFDRVLASRGGDLWVRDYELPWSTMPSTWRVFGSDGVARAIVRTPSGLFVEDVGDDYVLGVRRDSLDVPQVQLLRFTRN